MKSEKNFTKVLSKELETFFMSLPNDTDYPEHQYSENFMRSFNALVEKEKQQKKIKSSFKFKAMVAASFLILSLSGILVYGHIVHSDLGKINASSASFEIKKECQPSFIPEGFTLQSSVRKEDLYQLIYVNNKNEKLVYKQSILNLDELEQVNKDILINGNPSYFFVEDNLNHLFWSDGEYQFLLISYMSLDDLVKIANSVA